MPWLVISSETVSGEEKRISIELQVVFSFDKGFRKMDCLYVIQESKTVPTQQHLFDSITAPPLLHSNGRNWKN